MGLDVGVVRVNYLTRPENTTSDFLRHLGLNADDADWNGSTSMSTFVELSRKNMLNRVDEFASENNLARGDLERVRDWVDGLPWKNDMIMLHLGW